MSQIIYLTSSPAFHFTGPIIPDNRFIDSLRADLPKDCRYLYITSKPDDALFTKAAAIGIRRNLEDAGFTFGETRLLYDATADQAAELIRWANFIILSGGHTPTEHIFFDRIGLKELLADFNGVLMGISAGSMNAAEIVYAQPEEPGEGTDPDYVKYYPGLGLTKAQILPHYQMTKDNILDGLRLFEDIIYKDSMGHEFLAFPDGTYIYIKEGIEELRGECYLVKDGTCTKILENGETRILS